MLQALGVQQTPDNRLAELVPQDEGARQVISDAQDFPVLRYVLNMAKAHKTKIPVHTGGIIDELNAFGLSFPAHKAGFAWRHPLLQGVPIHDTPSVFIRKKNIGAADLRGNEATKFGRAGDTDKEAAANVLGHELGHILAEYLGVPQDIVRSRGGQIFGSETIADILAFQPSTEELEQAGIDPVTVDWLRKKIELDVQRSHLPGYRGGAPVE